VKLQLKTPRWSLPILKRPDARYLGAYGGRGSGKSHFFAEMLIERSVSEKVDAV
jgi:phage terminase large subunit